MLVLGTIFFVSTGAPAWAQAEAPQTHTVQAGETLSEIAAAYGVTLADLMVINGISDSNQIYVGQELTLPADAVRIGRSEIDIPTYTVAAGETLSQIAQRYGLSTTRLMFLNGISDADAIYIGQVLRLPVTVSTPGPAEDELAPADTPVDTDAPVSTTKPISPSPTMTSTAASPSSATASTPVSTPASTVGTATAVSLPAIHEVQPGETLSEIAKQYGLAMQALLDANGIQNADAIYSGQELRIPGAPTATATATPSSTSTVTPADSPTGRPRIHRLIYRRIYRLTQQRQPRSYRLKRLRRTIQYRYSGPPSGPHLLHSTAPIRCG